MEETEAPEPAQMQPALFDEADLDASLKEPNPHQAPTYTAARVLRDRPHAYRKAVDMLASGKHSQIEIARLLQMTERTVAAIRRQNSESITEARAKIAARAYGVGALAVDCVEEDLIDPDARRKISAKDKAIISGIMIDQAQKLTGAPTSIVGKLEAKPDHSALAAYRERMKAAQGDNGPAPYEMDFAGENNGNKREAAAAPGLQLPADPPAQGGDTPEPDGD